MIPLLLLALAAPVATSTASEWQRAGARWERLAEEALALVQVRTAERDEATARADATEATATLVAAHAEEEQAVLRLDVAAAEAQADARVSRAARTWAVVGGAACAAGAVGAVLGLALCDGVECRQVLGLGGAGLAAAGCVALGVAW